MFEKFNNGLWNMSKKSETVENVQVDLKNKQKKKITGNEISSCCKFKSKNWKAPIDSRCFSLSSKTWKNWCHTSKGTVGEVPSYSAFLLYSGLQCIEWGLPALGQSAWLSLPINR